MESFKMRQLYLSMLFPLIALVMPCSALLSQDEELPSNKQTPPQPPYQLPWLTGPIVCPSAHVVPYGHINYEPYFNANVITGAYNGHWKPQSKKNFYNMNVQGLIQFGIAPRLDFTMVPQFSWNHTDGASHWVGNDLPLGLDFQIYSDTPGTWAPAVKLGLKATVPIGRYQKFDPNDKGTDDGGSGSWNPAAGLVFGHLFHFTGVHFLASRLAFFYTIPNSVHVKGLNNYGGGRHTYGRVYPGQTFFSDLGLEYTLAQKWALALDIVYTHTTHTRFKGRKGKTDGVPNSIGAPSNEEFSLAPAIEYNWNENCGVIAGVFFSVAGRNTAEFINGVIAVNIYR